MRILKIIIPIVIFIAIFSCRKENIITDNSAKLSFSTDTVMFDTVFTTIGSSTKSFKVYNPHKESIKVSSIILAGGSNSNYRLNIDGKSTTKVTDVEIAGNDSLYIFVEVNVDPTNSNSPLVVQDSVVFITNNNIQDIDLVSWGQDVHLVNAETLKNDAIWTNEKPHLVYNSVLVDTLVKLTIEQGTQIHFHRNSSMLVKGTLEVKGELGNEVVFQGDRLDHAYDEISGQWGQTIEYDNGGIYLRGGIHFFQGSFGNEIDYAIIKNAIKGIQLDSLMDPNVPTLTISNTIINNMNYAGILAQGSSIKASNCVIGNCGYYSLALLYGGSYEFYHSTIANYSTNGNRTTPAVVLQNYFVANGIVYARDMNNAYFGNCIIYGGEDNELELNAHSDGVFNFKFDHCLLKVDTAVTDVSNEDLFENVIINQNPKFVSTNINDDVDGYDYQLQEFSPALDTGKSEIITNNPPLLLNNDINGNSRTSDKGPDLGAYERVE